MEAADEARRLRARIVALEHALKDARGNGGSNAGGGGAEEGQGATAGLLSALAAANRRVLALEQALREREQATTAAATSSEEAEAGTGEEAGEEDVRAALDRARKSVLVLTATRDALQAQLDGAMRCVVWLLCWWLGGGDGWRMLSGDCKLNCIRRSTRTYAGNRDAVREKDGHSEAEARLEAARTEVGGSRRGWVVCVIVCAYMGTTMVRFPHGTDWQLPTDPNAPF